MCTSIQDPFLFDFNFITCNYLWASILVKWLNNTHTYCCTLQASHMRIALRKFLSDFVAILSASSTGKFRPSFLQTFWNTPTNNQLFKYNWCIINPYHILKIPFRLCTEIKAFKGTYPVQSTIVIDNVLAQV